jgi:hypothetical protein
LEVDTAERGSWLMASGRERKASLLESAFFPLLFRGDDMRRHLDPLMHCLRLLLQCAV